MGGDIENAGWENKTGNKVKVSLLIFISLIYGVCAHSWAKVTMT